MSAALDRAELVAGRIFLPDAAHAPVQARLAPWHYRLHYHAEARLCLEWRKWRTLAAAPFATGRTGAGRRGSGQRRCVYGRMVGVPNGRRPVSLAAAEITPDAFDAGLLEGRPEAALDPRGGDCAGCHPPILHALGRGPIGRVPEPGAGDGSNSLPIAARVAP